MDVRKKETNDKRLIDYDEIRRLFDVQYKETVRLIRDGETHLDNLAEGFTEADRIIQKIPTVDAVEVVRCKDCKHKTKYFNSGKFVCKMKQCVVCGCVVGYIKDDGFCSYGERKEGDD